MVPKRDGMAQGGGRGYLLNGACEDERGCMGGVRGGCVCDREWSLVHARLSNIDRDARVWHVGGSRIFSASTQSADPSFSLAGNF